MASKEINQQETSRQNRIQRIASTQPSGYEESRLNRPQGLRHKEILPQQRSRPTLQRMPAYCPLSKPEPSGEDRLQTLPTKQTNQQGTRHHYCENVLSKQVSRRQRHSRTTPDWEFQYAVPSPRRRNPGSLLNGQSLDCVGGLGNADVLSPVDDNVPRKPLDYELHAELARNYLLDAIKDGECYPGAAPGYGEFFWGGWCDGSRKEEDKFPGLREGRERAAMYKRKRKAISPTKLVGQDARAAAVSKSTSISTDEAFLNPELVSIFRPEGSPTSENALYRTCNIPSGKRDSGYTSFEDFEPWFPT